jgi:phosphomannomutase
MPAGSLMNSDSYASRADSLRSHLQYEPQALQFGTSGRRGLVVHLTQLELYINALAELRYLQSLPPSEGGITHGDELYFAYDLRPSSTEYVPGEGGRGELAQAIVRAIRDAGMRPVNMGAIPTPALANLAISRGKGSIMITGSHIPFDRNGYKTNTSRGELLKEHEEPIGRAVEQVRQALYNEPFASSKFDASGRLKSGHCDLPAPVDEARSAYVRRYTEFFAGQSLRGMRLLFYQHSAVGRDLVPEILLQLGADVITTGRSDTFVPIDTENIDTAQLAVVQSLVDEAAEKQNPIDAVVSTDGDSDRPLLLGVDRSTNRVCFFGGDLLGMVVAEYLGADAVVVPISCNDAIDRSRLRPVLEPKTRIGSPYVIAGMERARSKGRRAICGWEANGGFLTGSAIERNGKVLEALPTRDAMLPLLAVLFSAHEQGFSLGELFHRLPPRFSRAALLKQFPRPVGLAIVKQFSPKDSAMRDVQFESDRTILLDADGIEIRDKDGLANQVGSIKQQLSRFFTPPRFGAITRLNYTDGVRITFANGDVAHLRPSGNADELRIYAVSDTQARAEEIIALGIAEPDGILRSLEKLVT